MKKRFYQGIAAGFILLSFWETSTAQLGFNSQYRQQDFRVWNEMISDFTGVPHELFGKTYTFGIDFGFDSPGYRISFFPELNYQFSSTRFDEGSAAFEFSLVRYAFVFKTFVYPLDLLSKKSMECPSFYRGMDKFTKGWFIAVLPELAYSAKNLLINGVQNDNMESLEDAGTIFNFGFGTGLDIGLTKYLSISPFISYGFIIGEKWNGLSEGAFDRASFSDPTGVSGLSLALRLGLWF